MMKCLAFIRSDETQLNPRIKSRQKMLRQMLSNHQEKFKPRTSAGSAYHFCRLPHNPRFQRPDKITLPTCAKKFFIPIAQICILSLQFSISLIILQNQHFQHEKILLSDNRDFLSLLSG